MSASTHNANPYLNTINKFARHCMNCYNFVGNDITNRQGHCSINGYRRNGTDLCAIGKHDNKYVTKTTAERETDVNAEPYTETKHKTTHNDTDNIPNESKDQVQVPGVETDEFKGTEDTVTEAPETTVQEDNAKTEEAAKEKPEEGVKPAAKTRKRKTKEKDDAK